MQRLPRKRGGSRAWQEERERQEHLDLGGCGQGRAPVFGSSPQGTVQEEFQGIPRHSTWVPSRQKTEEVPLDGDGRCPFPRGQRWGPVPGCQRRRPEVIPGGGQPGGRGREWPRAREGVSLLAPGAPRFARDPAAAGQRHARQGTRYSPGPGRPVARGLPAWSPAPAPVGRSRTRAQVGGGGLIALTQDGGGGFATFHVVIGVLKRAAPCPWLADSGPRYMVLRCWWSRLYINLDAASSREGWAVSLKHPQKRAATGMPQYTCAHNQHVRRRLPWRVRCSRGRPPRRC